jgi:23S rRNA (cytosine1962-C5)-methyltransferase
MRLKPTAETIIRGGHPWIFAESIKEQNREGLAGELAIVFDRNDKFLAVGFYDPGSPIRVRVIHVGKPVQIDSCFWKLRLEQALAKRAQLFGADTTGYRCIHGENDGFPGLVLDRYADTCVFKIYTAAWRERVGEIVELLENYQNLLTSNSAIVLRSSRNLNVLDVQILRGEPKELVQFLENGVRFEADVLRGQKTGFFLDQRENRKMVGSLSEGRDVLNAFSFSGGFSVYAARGGARSVTDLDISGHALASAKRNFQLNNFERVRHETVQADTFEFLAQKPTRRFGMIILDPPSLAKRESEREGALRAYRKLIQSALPWLARDGILVAASCSAHVAPKEFFLTATEATGAAGLKEFCRTENPADHPATFPEARYLKCIYFR